MSALILLDSLSVGGSQRKSVRIANELFSRGRRIHLAYLNEPATLLPDIHEKIPVFCLNRRGKFSASALRKLHEQVVQNEISTILCMNLYPLLYAALLKLVYRLRKLTVILAINTTEFIRTRDRWYMLIYAPLIRRSESVVFGCKYQRDLWCNRYSLEGPRHLVIYNGVDTDYFNRRAAFNSIRAELNIDDSFVIGTVGRLDPEKNQAALLQTVAALKDRIRPIDLIIIGDGSERHRLESLASTLGIREHVHFLGQLADIRAGLRALDVFVLPSISVETFSNAALEAMAMEVPVVLSNIAGASEMVSHGDNGYLYERFDVAQLADRLTELSENGELRRAFSRNALQRVSLEFNTTQMFDKYDALLYSV